MDHRELLKRELENRQTKNARYSLRGFARLLRCDPTYLSKVLSGKMLLSVDRASDFANALSLSPDDRKNLILSTAEEQRCNAVYAVDPSLTNCDSESDEDSGPCSKE